MILLITHSPQHNGRDRFASHAKKAWVDDRHGYGIPLFTDEIYRDF
jgi:hypothetical protein